jgi:Icc-related predicted phosphoesterase
MGFNVKEESELEERMNSIPEDLDILMTHCPPKNKRDKIYSGLNIGCKYLAKNIEEKKPKFVVFGHIHESYGVLIEKETTFINGASCTMRYRSDNAPIVFDVPIRSK